MPVPEIDCAALRELLAASTSQRPLLLDVRFPDEHAFAALAGSTLIPLPELAARAAELTPFKDTPIVVYCHHGVRSLSGAGLLQSMGFDAVSLRGGIDAWSLQVDPTLPRY